MRGLDMGAPDSDVARMKKGKKGPLIAIAAIAVVAIAGGTGFYFWKNRAATQSSSKAYGALWGCMVGQPLDEGESLESRLRSISAALGDAKGDWPKRCDDEATAFYEALGSDAKTSTVKDLMEIEVKCSTHCSAEILVSKLGQIDEVAAAAKIKPEGAADVKDPPPRLSGKPLRADAFRDLVPGTAALQGMTAIGENRTALLYRDKVGTLYVCEVDPDGETPIRCGPITIPIRAATARLVEGKSKPTLSGVTEMAQTAEDTKHGVFDAWSGQPTEDDAATVQNASDRPRLPPASGAWVDADLGGVKAKLARTPNGVLRLDRGDDPPKFVMDDADHDGPGTGEPIPFVGHKRAVIVFTAKHGLSALVLDSDGSAKPAQ